jgi:Sulphur transport
MMGAISPLSIAFAIAFLSAALMGYAIQRGATCMVAAVDEVVTQRRALRLIALLEAGLWVAGGIVLARLIGGLKMYPTDFPVTWLTVAGGAILGVGALINRACVFGSIARFGSGEWAYAVTPVGFFFGCLATTGRFKTPVSINAPSPLFAAALWVVAPFLLFAAWRGAQFLRAARRRDLAAHIWSPHQATMVIGLAFVVMLLTVGSWAYTEVLASLARGMVTNVNAKVLLFLGLFGGALTGGWTAGRLRSVRPTGGAMLRCLIGGFMMGAGGLLTPGNNDGLILLGLPLLQPHAIVALVSMALAIVAGMTIERRFMRR